jgi:hypothetical protein
MERMTTEATEYHEFINHKNVSLSSSGKALKVLTEGILTYKQTDNEYKIR